MVESAPERGLAAGIGVATGRRRSRPERMVRDQELRGRIEATSGVMSGKPCIRGTRIPVRLIVNMLAHGATFEEIVEDYPRLTRDDILACLLYAARCLDQSPSDVLATVA